MIFNKEIIYLKKHPRKMMEPHLKGTCNYCLVTQSCSTLLQPYGLWPTRLLCPWAFPGKNTGVTVGLQFPSPGDLPDPEIEPASPSLAGRLFTTEPPRKPFIRYYLQIKGLYFKINEAIQNSMQ